MHPTINRATLELMKKGIVKSCSLMAVGKFFDQAVSGYRGLGGKRIGVHLALQGEYSTLKVRPVLPAEEIPSLVDKEGYLRPAGPSPDIEEATRELRAQIEKVRIAGLKISHVDGHMFFYDQKQWGESLLDTVKTFANELKVPFRLQHNALFIWEGYDTAQTRFDFYDSLIESGEAGQIEILLHPAENADEMAAFSGAGARRLADFHFFSQPDLGDRLKTAGIQIESWADPWA